MSWSNCVGDCVNGQGTFTWPDGQKYVGQWKDGNYDGQGTLTLADGQKYVGQFKDGNYDGQGTMTLADGQKYVGQFKDGNYDGQGTMTLADGSKKTGIWQEGVYFGTIVEWERAEKERITAEQMRQRAKQEADEKAEKERIAAEKIRRRLKQEADNEYDRIYNACLLDKGASVDMQVSSLERALKNVCDGIAKDPSWLDSVKYD